MTKPRTRRRAAVAVMAALAIGACSSAGAARSASKSTSSPEPTTTRPQVAPTTTDPTASERQQIIAAYEASWTTWLPIAASASGNPEDPALAQAMADPLLSIVRQNTAGLRAQHLTEVGPVAFHEKILAMSATDATLDDCLFDGTDQVNVLTGVHVPPIYPRKLLQAHLVLTPGGWKVDRQFQKAPQCDP